MFFFLRERERKRVSLLWNNFPWNWFNFNFCSETIFYMLFDVSLFGRERASAKENKLTLKQFQLEYIYTHISLMNHYFFNEKSIV